MFRVWFSGGFSRLEKENVARGLETATADSRSTNKFREGLVFKAHRLLYHSTLGLRVTQKKKKKVFTATFGKALEFSFQGFAV